MTPKVGMKIRLKPLFDYRHEKRVYIVSRPLDWNLEFRAVPADGRGECDLFTWGYRDVVYWDIIE